MSVFQQQKDINEQLVNNVTGRKREKHYDKYILHKLFYIFIVFFISINFIPLVYIKQPYVQFKLLHFFYLSVIIIIIINDKDYKIL